MTAHVGMTTEVSNGITDAGAQGIRWIRRLVIINLALVALQPISAGFFLSGYGRAVAAHATVALALQVGTLIQALTAAFLWRRRGIPGWVAGISLGLLVMVFLEVGLGYQKQFWLHVPIGVGLFGGLMRQVTMLDTLSQTTRPRP